MIYRKFAVITEKCLQFEKLVEENVIFFFSADSPLFYHKQLSGVLDRTEHFLHVDVFDRPV